MKNVNRFVALATLVAIVSVFFVSCSFSTAQEMAYQDFIEGLVYSAHYDNLDKEYVKKRVEKSNEGVLKSRGIKVTDKNEGEGIAKGTDGATLKKRFPVTKI